MSLVKNLYIVAVRFIGPFIKASFINEISTYSNSHDSLFTPRVNRQLSKTYITKRFLSTNFFHFSQKLTLL